MDGTRSEQVDAPTSVCPDGIVGIGILLKRASKAGLKGTLAEPFSPHGLRAGFVTTAYRNAVYEEILRVTHGIGA